MFSCLEIKKKILTKAVFLLMSFILGIAAVGLHHIEASAKPNNEISGGTNNIYAKIVAVANPMPDLVVKDITLSPEDPEIEDTVTITATIKNQGTSDAGHSYVACYIDDTLLTSKSIGPIDAGTAITITCSWVAQVGSHTIKVHADSSNKLAEIDETNNTKTFTFSTVAPDLIIQSISWLPEDPSRGDGVVFSITIKNQGTSKSCSTNINFYIDGNSRGYQDVLSIDAGGTVTKTYTWAAKVGQHPVKATVDEANNVNESNEANNEQTVTFSTLPPDLIVQEITWSPESPSKNDKVTFTANVTNQGSGRSDSCHIACYIDEVLESSALVSTIEAGASTSVTFSWTAWSGLHDVKVIIDSYNNLIESDETNNENTVSLMTLAPDLIVKDITWTPEDAAAGDTVTFTVTIKNQGSGDAEKSRAAYYIDGYYTGHLDIEEIDADAEVTATFQWAAVAGSHNISIVANNEAKFIENDTENNKQEAIIHITPPDLVIPNISWSPERPSIGDMVTFTITVKNQGSGKAASSHLAYYIDDAFLTSDYVGTMESGASVNKTYSWKSQNGLHTFKAIADYYTRIPEGDEGNNENSVIVSPNMPDLIIDHVTWLPPDTPVGDEVTFDIKIKNQGSLRACSSRLAYYVDGSIVGYKDVGEMEAGVTVTESLPWIATAGSHTIKIVADSNDQVAEIDETNNGRTVNLPPPDLTIQDITWSPTEASVGDTVSFTASIVNQGSGKTNNSQVTYYIDGVSIGYQDLPEMDSGNIVTKTLDWVAEAGTHIIKIAADSNNLVTETDETNNEKETDFSTLTPDLLVQDISWSMEYPSFSDDVTFVVTLKNQGSDKADISQLTCYIDDSSVGAQDIKEINAGDIVTETFVIAVEAGPHTVKIVTDSNNQVAEIDETNNEEVLSFSTIVPDLVVKDITWSPMDAAIGDTVTFTVTIENQGRDKALNPRLALYVDDSPVDYCDVEEIEAGDIVTRDFTWIAEAGSHDIRTFVDLDEMVLESNEINNEKQRTLSLPATGETGNKAVKLTPSSSQNGGFLGDWFWLLFIVTMIFGSIAFVLARKSINRF